MQKNKGDFVNSFFQAQVILSLVDKFTKPLNNVKNSVRTFEDTIPVLTGLGTKMMIGGGAALFLGKGFLTAAGQMESYRATLKNMFGGDIDKAENRLKELSDIAASTPFELPEVIEAGNKLQALSRYSKETLIQLGDMSSFAGKPMEQALSAFSKMASGQKGIAVDMFRDMLITTDDWQKATGKGISKNGELLATTEELLAVLPKILKDKGALGAMDAQSKTFKGVMSNLSDSFFQFKATFGEAFLAPVKSVAKTISGIVSAVTEWAESHKTLATIISRVVGLTAFLSVAVGGLLVLYASWRKMSRALYVNKLLLSKSLGLLTENIWTSLLATKPFIAAQAQMKLSSAAGAKGLIPLIKTVWAFTASLLSCPAVWIAIAILGIVGVLYLLYKNWDKVKDSFKNIFAGTIKEIQRLKDNLKGLFKAFNFNFDFKAMVGDLAFFAGFLVGTLANFFDDIFGGILGGINNVIEGIKLIFEGDLLEGFRKLFVGLAEIIFAPINAVLKLIGKTLDLVKGNFKTSENAVERRDGKAEGQPQGNVTSNSRIEGFSKGVSNFAGGLAYVHSDELISLPKGSSVHTKNETKKLFDTGKNKGNTIVNNSYVIQKVEFFPDSINQIKKIADIFMQIEGEVCF